MEDNLMAAIVGGFIGGILGVVGTIFSSYYGPRKLEEWKENRKADKWDNPRKKLLLNMLDNPKMKMRSIETLCRGSGTTEEECRRLLLKSKPEEFD